MIARTHGQPASPTKLGKEIKVFITRINEQLKLIRDIPNADKEIGNIKIPAPIMLPMTSVNDSLNSILFSILCTLFTI